MPGPGHFGAIDDWSKHDKHAAGFGSSKRSNVAASKEGPGPGNYTYSSKDLNNAPAYSLAGRKGDKYFNYNPGPGAYNPDISAARESLGKVRIGTSKRDSMGGNSKDIPGPGNYNMSNTLGG